MSCRAIDTYRLGSVLVCLCLGKNMKNDDIAKQKQKSGDITKKVEDLMGPAPENPNTLGSNSPERYKANSKKPSPTTAPTVNDVSGAVGATFLPQKDRASSTKQNEQPNDKSSDDSSADKIVDQIAEKESDDALKAEDEAIEKAANQDQKHEGPLKKLWHSRYFKKTLLFLIITTIAVLAIVPSSRYMILNAVGVRSKASLFVIDNSTQQPLKNVNVQLGDQSATTNQDGFAALEQIRLGDQELVIERRAFEKTTKEVTIGLGSNPLGNTAISPAGLQFAFNVKDYLSQKPIEKAEVYSGDASAFTNKDGEALLTLDVKGDEAVEIKIRADDYREETIKDDGKNDNKPTSVLMVADKKHIFISKRSGKYDVYKIDADGKNEELVLSGTGAERKDMTLTTHGSGDRAALVSTRDNIRNADGVLLSTLTLIEVDTNKTQPLDTSERVQIVGWIDDSLVYVLVDDGAKKNGASTHKLVSYDIKTESKTEIAKGLFLNDVAIANDRIYYAPAAELEEKVEGEDKPKVKDDTMGLFSTDREGKDKQRIIEQEIWSIFRQDYDTLALGAGQNWFEYKLGSSEANKLSGPPAEQVRSVFVKNEATGDNLWVDKRDGKGVLLVYDAKSKENKTLLTLSGLTNPVRWLNKTTAVFRLETQQETTDYVVNIEGGDHKKLVDATNTSGVDNWYYY